jgi:hypothetical protein
MLVDKVRLGMKAAAQNQDLVRLDGRQAVVTEKDKGFGKGPEERRGDAGDEFCSVEASEGLVCR